MKNLKIIFVVAFVAILTSCSKNDDAPAPVVEAPTFKQFVPLTTVFPTDRIWGMDYHPATKNLYICSAPPVGFGFKITQINTDTKQATLVYSSPTTIGNSFAQIIRVFGNSIYLTSFGNKNEIRRLDGIGNNMLTLGLIIAPPINASNVAEWTNTNDIAIAGKIYLLNNLRITVGDNPNFANRSNFLLSNKRESSIVYTSINNIKHIICHDGEQNGKINAYNAVSGDFIRSVPSIPFGNDILVKDSQDRVYTMGFGKIIRFSADLLTKEEFIYDSEKGNITEICQFAIAEIADKIIIYGFNGVTAPNGGSNFGIFSISIPK